MSPQESHVYLQGLDLWLALVKLYFQHHQLSDFPDVDVDGLPVALPADLEMLNCAEVWGIALDELVAEVRCILVLTTDGAKGNVEEKVTLVSDSRWEVSCFSVAIMDSCLDVSVNAKACNGVVI